MSLKIVCIGIRGMYILLQFKSILSKSSILVLALSYIICAALLMA